MATFNHAYFCANLIIPNSLEILGVSCCKVLGRVGSGIVWLDRYLQGKLLIVKLKSNIFLDTRLSCS